MRWAAIAGLSLLVALEWMLAAPAGRYLLP